MNFKFQQKEDSAAVSVPLLLARLKEDTKEMLKTNSEKGKRLSKLTVQRLTSAMIDINKISWNLLKLNDSALLLEIFWYEKVYLIEGLSTLIG